MAKVFMEACLCNLVNSFVNKNRARCKTLSYTKAPAFPKKGLAGASVCVTIKV